ncbi:MAG: hypothetical protein V1734_04165 [Nanoarchaeota archaeon]
MNEINTYLQDRFGISVTESFLCRHSDDEWKAFSEKYGFNADGAYFVRDKSAHVNSDSDFALIDVFHEYFGHGFYVEHSMFGKELYSLERKLLNEEQESGIKPEGLSAFRESNETCRQIADLQKRMIAPYEGFAMWMEWHLAMLAGKTGLYEKKAACRNDNANMLASSFISFSKQNTDYALLYANGFPKNYDIGILNEIARNVFRNDLNSIDFALVYGSQKPYSDIDLFIVSDNIPCFSTGWLDVYSVSRNSFSDLLSKLDISITDALFTGELIYGDKTLFENVRKKAASASPSKEAIEFHLNHVSKAKELSEKCIDAGEKRSSARYAVSYYLNAIEMRQGRKPLTLKALKEKYPEEFKEFEKPKTYIQ